MKKYKFNEYLNIEDDIVYILHFLDSQASDGSALSQPTTHLLIFDLSRHTSEILPGVITWYYNMLITNRHFRVGVPFHLRNY